MKNVEPKTLKGFRDFLPKETKKRQYAIDTLKKVFESYGFEPLETPALEYEEVLLGKYGEEGDKLMYRFVDNGGRRVALRYDQTVPLSRVVAQYSPRGGAGQNELSMPFKRYQIQPVWRAENTQKGRFREFLQCDVDIVGTTSPLSDAEVIAVATNALKTLGFKDYKVLINDRNNFSYFQESMNLSQEQVMAVIRAIDKLKKIGRDGVINELKEKGFSYDQAATVIDSISNIKPTEYILEIMQNLKKMGIKEERIQFYPTLARGLDYYTDLIFEIEIEGYTAGSVCGGGRYDKLIAMFSDKDIPAVGFAFGFDRLIEAMDALKLFPDNLETTKVLVTIFSKELKEKSIEISSRLRSNNINTEIYLDENAKLEKQLKYADQKGIPYVVVIGPEEAEKNQITLKNMQTREQKTFNQEGLVKELA
ncbi:MAG: histidine--tRNA ligase [Candidatus Levybacteria bacterium]|nr:histidine--tRNA ligase [Candidatus Levybacteria bacterium]